MAEQKDSRGCGIPGKPVLCSSLACSRLFKPGPSVVTARVRGSLARVRSRIFDPEFFVCVHPCDALLRHLGPGQRWHVGCAEEDTSVAGLLYRRRCLCCSFNLYEPGRRCLACCFDDFSSLLQFRCVAARSRPAALTALVCRNSVAQLYQLFRCALRRRHEAAISCPLL
jgi:hypothetical protein